MAKKKWKRIKPAELANAETQQLLMGLRDKTKGLLEPDSPEKRTHENPQVE